MTHMYIINICQKKNRNQKVKVTFMATLCTLIFMSHSCNWASDWLFGGLIWSNGVNLTALKTIFYGK